MLFANKFVLPPRYNKTKLRIAKYWEDESPSRRKAVAFAE
jgi:hypothetical protein